MTLAKYLFGAVAALAVLTLFHIDPALAQEAAAEPPPAPTLDTGDTAWMLTSTALVLMMTIPGLALFYGGMVRKKNVLSVVMQCFAITCLITIVWLVAGYSLAFTDGGALNSYIGGLSKALLKGVGKDSLTLTIPEVGVLHLPDDLRHHHAGAYRRRVCRPHEVLRAASLHGAVVADRLCARSPTGYGAAASWPAPACSTSPAARWCISTPASPGLCLRHLPRQALRLRHGEHGAA